jgi:uncharacterized protein YndB with AHSA1/START domain
MIHHAGGFLLAALMTARPTIPIRTGETKMPKFEREVEIDAPVEKVWQVMTEPKYLDQWFPGVDKITASTPGRSFEWVADGRTVTAAIVSAEVNKRLEITTQRGDDKDLHVFELKPSGGFLGMNADECKVTYTLDTLMGGGILTDFIVGGNPVDTRRVVKAMNRLRKLVESL